jgi:hypothetical protein
LGVGPGVQLAWWQPAAHPGPRAYRPSTRRAMAVLRPGGWQVKQAARSWRRIPARRTMSTPSRAAIVTITVSAKTMTMVAMAVACDAGCGRRYCAGGRG